MKQMVIEVRGGIVQEVYNNVNDLQVILVDWDNIEASQLGRGAEELTALSLKRMPDETRAEVEAL